MVAMADWDGGEYQARFDEFATSGRNVHGEADFVTALGPASVLDAGCGTGRVAIELARRGIAVVGVDASDSMLAVARKLAPEIVWVLGDVAEVELGRSFEVVLMAGNVPLFTPPGTQPALVKGCARHLAPGGALVAGFRIGEEYPLDAYDADCAASGLILDQRWSSWDKEDWGRESDYAVSIHRHVG